MGSTGIGAYMEFREIQQGHDAVVEVYLLGVHVHTIKRVWSRPGGSVYTEKEMCVRQAEQAIRRLWDQAGAA